MTRKQAIARLKKARQQQEQHPDDDNIMKTAHLDADIVLYEFLESNGYYDIARAWDEVEGCYD